MTTEFEISISCQNLANKDLFGKSDPVAILLKRVGQTKRFSELGRTELIMDCLNPKFVKKFRVQEGPEENDVIMRVALVDIDDFDDLDRLVKQDFIGRAEFKSTLLFTNPSVTLNLGCNSGKVTFKTVRYDPTLDGQVTLQLANHSFQLKKGKPVFLEIQRADEPHPIKSGARDDDEDYTVVYRTEHSTTAEFEPIQVSLFTLALGDRHRQLRFELWRASSKGDHVRLGRRDATLMDLERLYLSEPAPVLEFDVACETKAGKKDNAVAERFGLLVKRFDLMRK